MLHGLFLRRVTCCYSILGDGREKAQKSQKGNKREGGLSFSLLRILRFLAAMLHGLFLVVLLDGGLGHGLEEGRVGFLNGGVGGIVISAVAA